LEDLRNAIGDFNRQRDWKQFHSPKNLAMALSVEVSEVVEHFQWLTEEQSKNLPGCGVRGVTEPCYYSISSPKKPKSRASTCGGADA
jgi:dCTP diphosphatase